MIKPQGEKKVKMTLEILIADDRYAENVTEMMTMTFGDRVSCTETTSYDETLEAARANKYDIAVLDYNLDPDMDPKAKTGADLARELAQIQPDMKLTGLSSSWNEDNAREVGLTAYGNDYNPIIEYITSVLEQ